MGSLSLTFVNLTWNVCRYCSHFQCIILSANFTWCIYILRWFHSGWWRGRRFGHMRTPKMFLPAEHSWFFLSLGSLFTDQHLGKAQRHPLRMIRLFFLLRTFIRALVSHTFWCFGFSVLQTWSRQLRKWPRPSEVPPLEQLVIVWFTLTSLRHTLSSSLGNAYKGFHSGPALESAQWIKSLNQQRQE